MSRRPTPLPPQLRGRAFRVDEAIELSSKRLRSQDLWAPIRGVRVPDNQRTVSDICRAIELTLPPGSAFSHSTAARLWGLPLPLSVGDEVHITTPLGIRARRGPRIVGHQRPLPSGSIANDRSPTVTTLARTFCDMSEILRLAALVALGDVVCRAVGRETILAAIPDRPRSVLVHAIELLDPKAESPKESELRVLLISRGIEGLTANYELCDGGLFVARLDLALPLLRIALEYEGDYHRDRNQFRRDLARRRRIEALGWTYLAVTQADLNDPSSLLNDLHAAIARQR